MLDQSCPPYEILRCTHVGLLCVQGKAIDRPTMVDVASLLSNETLPKQPTFFIDKITEELMDFEVNLEKCSLNSVTTSTIEA